MRPAILVAFLTAKYALGFAPRVFSTNLLRGQEPAVLSVAQIESPEVKASDNFSEDVLVDLQVCLQTLEKRVEQGPGAISSSEVSDFEAAMQRIVEDMNMKFQQDAVPQAAAASDSPSFATSPQATSVQDTVDGSVNSYEFLPVVADITHGEGAAQTNPEDDFQLRIAASNMEAAAVSALLEAGLQMDEETTDAAFWAVVSAVDRAEERDEPLPADVPRMLHHIFEADLRHMLSRGQLRANVTCMQPDDSEGMAGSARRMNYIFDDSSHKDLPLAEGRCCEGGTCCDKCSRNIFRTFATEAESNFQTFPGIETLTFNELENVESKTILQFVRLVERVRRTIAYEYGLPLKSILPLQAYSRKYVAGTTQQGGGGGEGDFVILHTDEATHSGYHYSSVMYLSNHGEDFEGGDFVFNDPAPASEKSKKGEDEDEELDLPIAEQIRRAGRKLTPFKPTRGAAVIFSSGWENMHEVEKITSGIRYAVPCFFTTCPVPEAAYEQMHVGKPKTDEEIADDWLHLLLAHRHESPVESVGRVKELLMKWHYMCAPLSQH